MKIIKCSLPLDRTKQNQELPDSAKVLCVGMAESFPTLWLEVDETKAGLKDWMFQIVLTGEVFAFDYPSEYIGTAFDGPYEWHIYRLLTSEVPTTTKSKAK